MNGKCTYTGARVEFEAYGFVAPADLYMVDDVVVIRWNTAGMTREFGESEVTHVVLRDSGAWHRADLGVTVVPRRGLAGNPVR